MFWLDSSSYRASNPSALRSFMDSAHVEATLVSFLKYVYQFGAVGSPLDPDLVLPALEELVLRKINRPVRVSVSQRALSKFQSESKLASGIWSTFNKSISAWVAEAPDPGSISSPGGAGKASDYTSEDRDRFQRNQQNPTSGLRKFSFCFGL